MIEQKIESVCFTCLHLSICEPVLHGQINKEPIISVCVKNPMLLSKGVYMHCISYVKNDLYILNQLK